MRFYFFLFLSLLIVTPGCSREESVKKVRLSPKPDSGEQAPAYRAKNTLWFGFDLRLGPREDMSIYIPFLRYLESETRSRFRIKFSEKDEDTLENLGSGVTHCAAMGSLSYVIGASRYGITYLASGVNAEGDATQRSVIFTRTGSAPGSLSELRGKCFAFGAKMSATGHVIPRSMLEEAGVFLGDLEHYRFTGSDMNAVKSVLNGECHAGSIEDSVARKLQQEGKITVLKTSSAYPSSLIACNKELDGRTLEEIRTALLTFEPTGKHGNLLRDWDQTEMPLGFIRIKEPELNRVTLLARRFGLL